MACGGMPWTLYAFLSPLQGSLSFHAGNPGLADSSGAILLRASGAPAILCHHKPLISRGAQPPEGRPESSRG